MPNNKGNEYHKKLDIKKLLIIALIGIFVQISAGVILGGIMGFFPDTSVEYAETIDELVKLTPVIVIYTCLLAPFLEEVMFRGVFMQLIKLKLPFVAANIIQAILFSIYHTDIVQKVYAFILGLFIGYIVHTLGHILYGIVFHAAMNISGVLIQNFVPGFDNILVEVIIALAALVCIIILMRILRPDKADR